MRPQPAAAPAGPRDLAGRELGRYEVLCQLAAGGMAAVYVGRARGVAGFERLIAIKVLHPHLAYEEEFISMFLDEARLAARIRHPNVVPTLDISDTEGDGFFLVMEYIEGDHLGAVLAGAARSGERVPPAFTVRVLLDTLAGLSAAHALEDESGAPMRLVHRDVSPHNVLVGVDGIARLTDFGVAKAENRLTSTRAGQFKGKLAYMAPEQASAGEADQRSDLFSAGVILWESLVGRRLFRGENNAATLNRLLHHELVPPSAFVPDLAPFDIVCARALAREREARFQSADEFAHALEEAASACGVATSRRVGAEVEHRVGARLQAQRERVRAAATEGRRLSESEETSLPSVPSQSVPRPIRESVPSLNRPTARRPGTVGWALLGVAALLLSALVTWKVATGTLSSERLPARDPSANGPNTSRPGSEPLPLEGNAAPEPSGPSTPSDPPTGQGGEAPQRALSPSRTQRDPAPHRRRARPGKRIEARPREAPPPPAEAEAPRPTEGDNAGNMQAGRPRMRPRRSQAAAAMTDPASMSVPLEAPEREDRAMRAGSLPLNPYRH